VTRKVVLNCIANMTFLALRKEKGFGKQDRKKNYRVRWINSFHFFQADITFVAIAVNPRAWENVSSNEGLNSWLPMIW
jgi:hypothetical protein